MGHLIAFALDAVNLVDFASDIAVIGEEIDQGASPGDEVVGHHREHRKKAIIFRNKADHLGAIRIQ